MIAQGIERTELEAHHAAIRSASHSSMKAENWFQLRVVGVTSIRPGFGRASSLQEVSPNRGPRFSVSQADSLGDILTFYQRSALFELLEST